MDRKSRESRIPRRSNSVDPERNRNMAKKSLIPHFRPRSGSMDSNRKTMGARPSGVQPVSKLRSMRPTAAYFTPMRTTMAPQLRGTASINRSPGSAMGKKIKEPNYIEAVCTRIQTCLAKYYPMFVLPKEFYVAPSRPVFSDVFAKILGPLDPSFGFLGVGKVTDEQVINTLKEMGYPAKIQKSALAVFTRTNWPNVLAALDFLVQKLTVHETVNENWELVAFPQRAHSKEVDFKATMFIGTMLDDYKDFMTLPANVSFNDDLDISRIKRKAKIVFETFHNLVGVDLESLVQQGNKLERQLEGLNELFNAQKADNQDLAQRIRAGEELKEELDLAIQNIEADIEETQRQIHEDEQFVHRREDELSRLQAATEELRKKVANQPMSHEDAVKLRTELRTLRESVSKVTEAFDNFQSIINERTDELAPLREESNNLHAKFQGAIIRNFGSKGLAEYGCEDPSTVDDTNIEEWFRLVGIKLQAFVEEKTAELDKYQDYVSRTSSQIRSMQTKLAKVRGELEQARNYVTKLSTGAETMRNRHTKEAEALDAKCHAMAVAVTELAAKVKKKESELETKQQAYYELARKTAEYESGLKVKRRQLKDLKEEKRRSIRAKLDEARKLYETFEQEFADSVAKMAAAHMACDKKSFENLKEMYRDLFKSVQEGVDDLKKKMKEVEDAKRLA